jgi:pimeloyl-CoA dehydrogenase
MDFSFDDDHMALRDAVQRFCDAEYPRQHRGNPETPALAAQHWTAMAELGLLGLPFDAELGGSAQGAIELMLVAQELGRALGGGAWLSSVVLAGQLLAESGTPAQCMQWLPKLASGELQIALACHEAQARHDPADVQSTARADGNAWVLNGRKSLVLHGDTAGLLLVVARTAGTGRDRHGHTLFAMDAGASGLSVKGFGTLDGRRAAHIELNHVRVDADRTVGPLGGALPLIDAALDRANAALVADAAGAMEALIELTTEHLRTRKQFGAPLARFQALQHRLADMLIALEQAKSMTCAAAMAVAEGNMVQRARIVSAAKALVGPLARKLGMDAIQLHGAMGMTDECRAGHYAKHLLVINTLFGDAAHHLRRFADQPQC